MKVHENSSSCFVSVYCFEGPYEANAWFFKFVLADDDYYQIFDF